MKEQNTKVLASITIILSVAFLAAGWDYFIAAYRESNGYGSILILFEFFLNISKS